MVTRLKLAGQRSHWIEVSRYRLRYKGNFHGQVIYAPIFEIGRFLSQVAQSLSGLASPNLDESVLTVCEYSICEIEQRHETAQRDDTDLQRPERTPVDQLGDVNE
jgi:hypothetical protein